MAPRFPLGGSDVYGRPFPPPVPFGQRDMAPQFRGPSFEDASKLTPAERLGQTIAAPMLWYWQHNPLAFWPFQHSLPRERVEIDGNRERQIDVDGSIGHPRELPDNAQRPVEPPSKLPQDQPPYPPRGSTGGLIGLMLAAKHLRRSTSRADSQESVSASEDLREAPRASEDRGVELSGSPDPDFRELARIPSQAARIPESADPRKVSRILNPPPLVPDQQPLQNDGSSSECSDGGRGNGGGRPERDRDYSDDYCDRLQDAEAARCDERSQRRRKWRYAMKCFDRATLRRDLCHRNGNRPPIDWPPEWGIDDEDRERRDNRRR